MDKEAAQDACTKRRILRVKRRVSRRSSSRASGSAQLGARRVCYGYESDFDQRWYGGDDESDGEVGDRLLVREYGVHMATGRKRPAGLIDYVALPSIAAASAKGGAKKKKKRMQSVTNAGRKIQRKRNRGKKGAGGMNVGQRRECSEGEKSGFKFFMKLFKEEMVNQQVPLSMQDVETLGKQIWSKMSSHEKKIFVQAALVSHREDKVRTVRKEKKVKYEGRRNNIVAGINSKEGEKSKKKAQCKISSFYRNFQMRPVVHPGISQLSQQEQFWKMPALGTGLEGDCL